MVEGESWPSGTDVTFAAAVAIKLQGPFIAGPRSTSKPSSSSELSVQARSIWLDDTAIADRLVGADGGAAAVGGIGVGVGVGVRSGVGVGVGVRSGVAVGVGVGVGLRTGGIGVGVGVAVGVGVGVVVGSPGISE